MSGGSLSCEAHYIHPSPILLSPTAGVVIDLNEDEVELQRHLPFQERRDVQLHRSILQAYLPSSCGVDSNTQQRVDQRFIISELDFRKPL